MRENVEHVKFSSGSKQTVSISTASSFISSFSPRRTSTKNSHERQKAKNINFSFVLPLALVSGPECILWRCRHPLHLVENSLKPQSYVKKFKDEKNQKK